MGVGWSGGRLTPLPGWRGEPVRWTRIKSHSHYPDGHVEIEWHRELPDYIWASPEDRCWPEPVAVGDDLEFAARLIALERDPRERVLWPVRRFVRNRIILNLDGRLVPHLYVGAPQPFRFNVRTLLGAIWAQVALEIYPLFAYDEGPASSQEEWEVMHRPLARPPQTCPRCHRSFVPRRSDQKWCSQECRWRGTERRRRAMRAAGRPSGSTPISTPKPVDVGT